MQTPAISASCKAPSSSSWSPGQAVETSLLFHPTKASEGWVAPPANLLVEDVWFKAADGNLIHAWVFNPVVRSLRAIQKASTLRKVQKRLGCPRTSLLESRPVHVAPGKAAG